MKKNKIKKITRNMKIKNLYKILAKNLVNAHKLHGTAKNVLHFQIKKSIRPVCMKNFSIL